MNQWKGLLLVFLCLTGSVGAQRLPGKLLVVDRERERLITLDPNSGFVKPLAQTGWFAGWILSADRKSFYYRSATGVRQLNLVSGEDRKVAEPKFYLVASSPVGDLLLAAKEDYRVWRLTSAEHLKLTRIRLDHESPDCGVMLNQGRHLLISKLQPARESVALEDQVPRGKLEELHEFDTVTGRSRLMGMGAWPAISPDSCHLAFRRRDQLVIRNLISQRETCLTAGMQDVTSYPQNRYWTRWVKVANWSASSLSFSGDSRYLAYIETNSRGLRQIRIVNLKLQRMKTWPARGEGVVWLED